MDVHLLVITLIKPGFDIRTSILITVVILVRGLPGVNAAIEKL